MHSKRLYQCPFSKGAMQKVYYAADTLTGYFLHLKPDRVSWCHIEYVSSNIAVHFLLACSSSLSSIVAAVMKCSKPTVPRHFLITIVALVIAMMQLVIERSQRQSAFISNKQVFVASMGHRCPWSKIDHMKIHKDRMAREHEMDQK